VWSILLAREKSVHSCCVDAVVYTILEDTSYFGPSSVSLAIDSKYLKLVTASRFGL
jgi:hypothetical protein